MEGSRFVGRREYFGSLFYDFERGDYIPFDWDATYIFELSPDHTIEQITEKIKNRVSKESFLTFVQLCQSIDLFDQQQKLAGKLLPYMPVKGRLSAPLRVHLQLTNECQLSCRHCSQDSRDRFPDELSVPEIYKLIDDMVAIGCFEMVIGGGDPFLKEKEILDVVKYACDRNVSVYISTTALFVGRVLAKRLSGFPIKGLRISFDGSTEKSFDYQRGKGAYRRVIRSIKTLRELFDCPITLHSVLMKSNYTEILSFLKTTQKLRCNRWSFDFAKASGSAKANPKIFLTPEEIRDTMRSIAKIQKNVSTPIDMRHFPYQIRGKRIYRTFGCVGGNLNCYIDASGNVFPCSYLRNYSTGNIRENKFRNLWIYSANMELLRNLAGNQVCKECQHVEGCRGGCRARAIEWGDQDGIDPACFVKIED